MKKISAIIIGLMMLFSMVGCGSKDAADPNVGSEQDVLVETEVVSNTDGDVQEAEVIGEINEDGTIRVGNSENGFVNIPSDWIKYKEINDDAIETQYSDLKGTSFIKLFSDSSSAGTVKEISDTAYYEEQAKFTKEMEKRKSEIAGFEAVQLSVEYKDGYERDGLGRFIWFFESSEGRVNTITIESTMEEIDELVELVRSSYLLEK